MAQGASAKQQTLPADDRHPIMFGDRPVTPASVAMITQLSVQGDTGGGESDIPIDTAVLTSTVSR